MRAACPNFLVTCWKRSWLHQKWQLRRGILNGFHRCHCWKLVIWFAWHLAWLTYHILNSQRMSCCLLMFGSYIPLDRLSLPVSVGIKHVLGVRAIAETSSRNHTEVGHGKQLLSRHAMIQTVRSCSNRVAISWYLQTELVMNHHILQCFRGLAYCILKTLFVDGPMFPCLRKLEMCCGSQKKNKGRLADWRQPGQLAWRRLWPRCFVARFWEAWKGIHSRKVLSRNGNWDLKWWGCRMADCKSVSVWVFQDSHVQDSHDFCGINWCLPIGIPETFSPVKFHGTPKILEITVRLRRSYQNKFLQRKNLSHFRLKDNHHEKSRIFPSKKRRWVYGEFSGYFRKIQDLMKFHLQFISAMFAWKSLVMCGWYRFQLGSTVLL